MRVSNDISKSLRSAFIKEMAENGGIKVGEEYQEDTSIPVYIREIGSSEGWIAYKGYILMPDYKKNRWVIYIPHRDGWGFWDYSATLEQAKGTIDADIQQGIHI